MIATCSGCLRQGLNSGAQKIASNITRDEAVHESLHQLGWRQLNVWECALKGKTRLGLEAVLETIIQWLNGDEAVGDIRGIA
jgi:DNA mismatch endonuclease (patch repair protein)